MRIYSDPVKQLEQDFGQSKSLIPDHLNGQNLVHPKFINRALGKIRDEIIEGCGQITTFDLLKKIADEYRIFVVLDATDCIDYVDLEERDLEFLLLRFQDILASVQKELNL